MAKRTTKKKTKAKPKTKRKPISLKLSNQQKLIVGSLLIILGVLFDGRCGVSGSSVEDHHVHSSTSASA